MNVDKLVLDIILSRRSVRIFDSNNPTCLDDILKAIENTDKYLKNYINPNNFNVEIISKKQIEDCKLKKGHQPQTKETDYTLAIFTQVNSDSKILTEAGIFIESLLLNLTSLGLSSLWISSFNESEVLKFIPDRKNGKLIALIPVGHCLNKPRTAKRRPMEERIHYKTITNKINQNAILEEAKKVNKEEYLLKNKINYNYLSRFSKSSKYFKAMLKVNNSKKIQYNQTYQKILLENILEVFQYAPTAKNFQAPEILINDNTIDIIGNLSRIKGIFGNSTTTSERAENLFIYLDIGAAIANVLWLCYNVKFKLNYKPKQLPNEYVYGYTFEF
jgi:nitroreductase